MGQGDGGYCGRRVGISHGAESLSCRRKRRVSEERQGSLGDGSHDDRRKKREYVRWVSW